MKTKIAFIVLILFSTGCTRSRLEDDREIRIERNLRSEIDVHDLFADVRFVLLESDETHPIGEAKKVIVDAETIFVSDGRNIFQYTKEGRYLRSLNRRGRGPQEYYDVLDFCVRGDELFIIDRNRKILKYTVSNEYVASATLDFYPATLFALDDGDLLLTSAYQNDVDKFHLYDAATFERLGSFGPIRPAELSYRHIMNQSNFFRYGDAVLFHEPMNDTIYRLQKDGLKVSAFLNLYGQNPPASFWERTYANVMEVNRRATEDKYCFGTPVYAENAGSILFTYRDAADYLLCRYSKRDGRSEQFRAIRFHPDIPPVDVADLAFGFHDAESLSIVIPDYCLTDSEGRAYAKELASSDGNPTVCFVAMR